LTAMTVDLRWATTQVSDSVRRAWFSVSNGSAETGDLTRVVEFIGREWAHSAADPRTWRAYLAERGIDAERLGRLSTTEVDALKAEFAAVQEKKTMATTSLVESVALNANCMAFYESLRPLSNQLKHLAYAVGIPAATGHNRALILSSLSQESADFASDVLKFVTPTPLVRLLQLFLNGWRYRLAATISRSRQDRPDDLLQYFQTENGDVIESVAASAFFTIPEIVEMVEGLRPLRLEEMAEASERMVNVLPTATFAETVKQTLAAFICTAVPNSNATTRLLPLLASIPDADMTDVLVRFAPEQLRTIFAAHKSQPDPTANRLITHG
jgi:hypothetical protein